jgi:hypothetical protein
MRNFSLESNVAKYSMDTNYQNERLHVFLWLKSTPQAGN